MAEHHPQGASGTQDPLRRGHRAPQPRTLVDVLASTSGEHPDATALDDGRRVLTYRQLVAEANEVAVGLAAQGIAAGDRVGVRIPSGTCELYVAILGVLHAGAAYVPVDADDPPERAALVFEEAAVAAVLEAGGRVTVPGRGERVLDDAPAALAPVAGCPTLEDDAWVIFTSGSTGRPKGVAVSHRSAAAFVDAEARLFLRDATIGPGDRVLAGLSVAFDASCEEMWLAWRYGACLVPAPRALVRSGMDLGPWLVAERITVVSTVPTLASVWPVESLSAVRLLIFGGEACPPELVARLATPGREVWNTYGPTEATVVACAARLTGDGPVRIGLPLDGWDLAVVDESGRRVADGGVGELVIGGVGLARYLDPAKDAEKYAPAPELGWERAYRSGDVVRHDTDGLLFVGRGDDQVKLGGRRIELGEVDAALGGLPGVAGAAAAVRMTPAGDQLLVGYVAPTAGMPFDVGSALERLRATLPLPLVPRLAVVDDLPTRTSGKIDRDALPWPLPSDPLADDAPTHHLAGTAGWVAGLWSRILGAPVTGADDDFFAHGGGSLTAARLVSALRERFPSVTVADVYENPRLGRLAEMLDEISAEAAPVVRDVRPVRRRAQAVQVAVVLALQALAAARWLTWSALLVGALHRVSHWAWLPQVRWWWVLAGWVLLVSPLGRMATAVAACRLLLRGVRPGTYPRAGSVHLRLWAAEQVVAATGAENLAGAPWIAWYARALGASVGEGVDLHSLPPVTGMLRLGDHCAVEPEVDLTGHWVDGDLVHIGRVRIGAGATVGARSMLLPGARVGQDAEVAAASAVSGSVPPGERWAGSPVARTGVARHPWPSQRPPRRTAWVPVYGLTAALLAMMPLLSLAVGLAWLVPRLDDVDGAAQATVRALAASPLVAGTAFGTYAVLVVVCARLLGVGLSEGHHAVRSRVGWQVWATQRLLDEARTWLFPLYSSGATPAWLRLLGASVGKDVEVSTVLLLPRMTTVGDGAFLADDTLVAGYELGGGWLRIERAKIGKRAFLGNSGITAPGRKVPKRGLVAVLSATPARAKAGSSWLGSPPVRLRREVSGGDQQRTFRPAPSLRVARAVVELCRVVPVVLTVAVGTAVVGALLVVVERAGWAAGALVTVPLLALAGVVAAAVTTGAKWLLVGRVRAQDQPLWSSFVWRNELADTFVEVLAVPWFARHVPGTALLTGWLRTLGARIGKGVWCESHWLPEADLVRVGDGATVNRGCVLQTHLFHDRIMSMDEVTLEAGATIGPHGVILPGAAIGHGTTVGPSSLVMRGEGVPAGTRWVGNPIAAWPVPGAR